ncbi:hypothetical protein C7999DRAFT_11127 [Corynascus novoguineensis]|uniref:Uncharacterized protein n=1 Tax=Corynascus novoguineensis TaxID=1126955 RepID=A0AAN7CZT4_9PEZI|nr:hypothetical protein C7999DRAFT_11127 [Corynascus novoguineensis]
MDTTNPPPKGYYASNKDSSHTHFALALSGAFVIGLALAFLIIWLAHRRSSSRARDIDGIDVRGDEAGLVGKGGWLRGLGVGFGLGLGVGFGVTTTRKLRNACLFGSAYSGWWGRERRSGLWSDDAEGKEGREWPGRRHVGVLLILKACNEEHFQFGLKPLLSSPSSFCRWSGQGTAEINGASKIPQRTSSPVNADAFDGPKVNTVGEVTRKAEKENNKNRGLWPSKYRTPTSPRVHHIVQEYPDLMSGAKDKSSEALLDDTRQYPTSIVKDYAQLQAPLGYLPQPPKPALVSNRKECVIKPWVTMGYGYGASRILKPIVSAPVSPARSAAATPISHMTRQQSTDSILTDILRSTEERLRERSVSGTVNCRNDSSPTRAPPSKTIGPRGNGVLVSRARTPSPDPKSHKELFSPGNTRQDSQQSGSSDTDSILGDQCPVPDTPSGLTSPSRVQKKQGVELQPLPAQSGRASLSSELSTLYSEDEMPDEVKQALLPLPDFVVQPQQAAEVRPPSVSDPFFSTPPPSLASPSRSVGPCPAKQVKPQDLLLQSTQQSQRLRSMPVGHARAQLQGLILAPGPMVHGPELSAMPPTRNQSATVPSSGLRYIASRNSEPPPSPTRQSPAVSIPTGPTFLRVTKTSTLSTIPMLPPPLAPSIDGIKASTYKPPPPSKAAHATSAPQFSARRSPVLLFPSMTPSSSPSSLSQPFIQLPVPDSGKDHDASNTEGNECQSPGREDDNNQKTGGGYDDEEEYKNRETLLTMASTTASVRHMNNNGISAALCQASVGPGSSLSVDAVSPSAAENSNTGSIKARTHSVLGDCGGNENGDGKGMGQQSKRGSRAVRCGSGGGGGIVKSFVGYSGRWTGGSHGFASKRRRTGSMHQPLSSFQHRPPHQRRPSSILSRHESRAKFAIAVDMGEGKEGSGRDGEGFKVAAGDFTFEVTTPKVPMKGELGLKEGSSGKVSALVMPQHRDIQRRLSLAWQPTEGGATSAGLPERLSESPSSQSMRSVDSLGLYDRQGFLISRSPVKGECPSRQRV